MLKSEVFSGKCTTCRCQPLVKLEIFHLSKHRNAPSDESASRSRGGRSAHETLYLRGSTLCAVRLSCVQRVTNLHPQVHILARVLGRPLISEKGWVEHCASAVTAGRLGKATGDVSSRGRSLKGHFRELLKVKTTSFH